ncbi:MAG: hypothetical protein ACLFT7_00065 [Thermoplasmata archaeon]
MKEESRLEEDEKGVMVFALVGVIILILSMYAAAYFASMRIDRQRDHVDFEELRKVDRELSKIETELNSAAETAGHQAAEKAKEEDFHEKSLSDIRKSIAENSAEILEDYFEERYSDPIEVGGFTVKLTMRPVREGRDGIELTPLYLDDGGDEKRSEIPVFFRIKRTVHAQIRDGSNMTVSTRKLEIDREIKTDIFTLAERADQFDPAEIRKMVDCMMSAYLNVKTFSGAMEDKVGFKKDFNGSFSTDWLEDYNERFREDGEEEREEPWMENSTRSIEGFERDIGKLDIEKVLSEEDLKATVELAVLLEQIKVFRSQDGSLLSSVSEHFEVEEDILLQMIGKGNTNELNLQRLILTLFQEKGDLPEEIFYPDLFLRSMIEEDLLSVIDESEEWTEVSFRMINDLVRGDIEGDDNWRYSDFSERTVSIEDLDARSSYLRTLFSMYSNSLKEVLKSFKVDSKEMDDFVFEEIKTMGSLSWMDDIDIIGDSGTDEIVRSILYRGKNLSMSFGFEEGSYETTASPFFYVYFFNDWGFLLDDIKAEDTLDQLKLEGIRRGVRDKISSEMRSRADDLAETAETTYTRVDRMVKDYNETEWYDPGDEDHREVWRLLNDTLKPLSDLSENELFEYENSKGPYISDELEEHHDDLEKKMGAVEEELENLDEEAREYTEKIIDIEGNYSSIKWRYEAYHHLYEGEKFEDFFNHTDHLLTASPEEISSSFNWSLESFSLDDHIDPYEKSDQSIGQRVLGNFTDEVVREWESPTAMNYTNPRGLFKLVNQNLFQLKGPGEGGEKSRLRSILLGEGDPSSDPSVKLIDGPVSSRERSKIEGWVIDDMINGTVGKLDTIINRLKNLSKELTDKDIDEDAFTSYADASFYRTAVMILDPMVDKIREFRNSIRSAEKSTGYPTLGEESVYERMPVISMPRGDLTLHRTREKGSDDLSYSLDLDVDISDTSEIVEVEKIDAETTRSYRGEVDSAHEWLNPFTAGAEDHYRTVFTLKYSTKAFRLELGTKKRSPLVSQRYSSSKLTARIDRDDHKGLSEVLSPVPLLERRYSPKPVDAPDIETISIDKNVFNDPNDRVGISIGLDDQTGSREGEFLVEVIQRDDMSSVSINQRDTLVNFDHLFSEDIERDKDQRILASKRISGDGLDGEKIDLELTLDDMGLPPESDHRFHLSVRVKSVVGLSYMKGRYDLDQTPAEGDHYSPVPIRSGSEQAYSFEDGRSLMEVFRVSNEKEQTGYNYDLITDLPKDSWIIQKNGVDYLVDFSEDMVIRDVLSGDNRGSNDLDPARGISFDPKYEVTGDPKFEGSLPESGYRRLLETDLIPLYMRVNGDDNRTIPESMIPVANGEERRAWKALHKTLLENHNLLSTSIGEDILLYHDIDGYHSKKSVNHSFNRADDIVDGRVKDSLAYDGLQRLKDSGVIGEFSNAALSGKRNLFLTSCYAGENIERVRELSDDVFELGPVAKSLDMIGEEKTRDLLEWLVEEREGSYSRELTAFLSLETDLVKNLPSRTDAEDYREGLYNLDELSEESTFARMKAWNIFDLKDIDSIHELRRNHDKELLFSAVGFGVRPSVLDEILNEKHLDLAVLLDSMRNLSDSSYFQAFLEQLNSGNYEMLPSLYAAGKISVPSEDWMPYGEERPCLIVNGEVVLAEIASIDSLSGLRDYVDRALKRSMRYTPERIKLIIEVPGYHPSEEDLGEIRGFVENKTKTQDPNYSNISSVSLNFADDTGVKYLHL